MSAIGAVILAAGAGRRLGGVAKAALVHDGQSFLERIFATCDEVGIRPRVVVVGPPFAEDVRAEIARITGALDARPDVITVDNPHPERGMASSVARGFARIVGGTPMAMDAALLWPVDHPFVSAETLRALANTIGAYQVAKPTYHGRGGHPPLIAREVWPELAACTNVEGGARTVLAGMQVLEVPVADPGVVRDVDVPADLS